MCVRLSVGHFCCVLWGGREVSRIALVSPERSRQIESIILHMVQSGQLRVSVIYLQICLRLSSRSLTGE